MTSRARKLPVVSLVVALVAIIGFTPTAFAYHFEANISGDVWQNHQVNYSTSRYMQYYDIVQMNKTDGPALTAGTYNCAGGNYSGGGYFRNEDPTGFRWIGGPPQYTYFCLYSISYGNNNYDWFSGVLRW